jgi:hypothetical protein
VIKNSLAVDALGQLDHGQEVGTEPLIASSDASIVLDAVEQTFDQVSLAVMSSGILLGKLSLAHVTI